MPNNSPPQLYERIPLTLASSDQLRNAAQLPEFPALPARLTP